jgi:hypothetical protein
VESAVIGRGRFAKDEELYEEEYKKGDGELPEQESLGKGKSVLC